MKRIKYIGDELSLSFERFDGEARSTGRISIVFLGGSLTWGAQATNPQQTSYRALIEKRLLATYPNARFEFWDAAIGGTGSQLAVFRLDRDVLSKRPSLVFLDFTINDDPYCEPQPRRLAAYESLVRRLVHAGIPVVQVILPAKKDMLPNSPARPLDQKHKEIGLAYCLPIADAVALAKKRVSESVTTPDLLWDLPEDSTHPGDAGYALYAEAVWSALEDAVLNRVRCVVPEKMLHSDAYMNFVRQRLTHFSLPTGWQDGQPHRNAVAYDFVCSRWMDDLVIAKSGARPLRFRIRGTDVLIFGEQTQKSGKYSVAIDGGDPTTYLAHNPDGNRRLVQIITENLAPDTEHTVEIVPLLEPGEELRIESLCIAGRNASVKLG